MWSRAQHTAALVAVMLLVVAALGSNDADATIYPVPSSEPCAELGTCTLPNTTASRKKGLHPPPSFVGAKVELREVRKF